MKNDILKVKIDDTILSINGNFKIFETNTPEELSKDQFFIDRYLDTIETDSPEIDGFIRLILKIVKY